MRSARACFPSGGDIPACMGTPDHALSEGMPVCVAVCSLTIVRKSSGPAQATSSRALRLWIFLTQPFGGAFGVFVAGVVGDHGGAFPAALGHDFMGGRAGACHAPRHADASGVA